MRFFELVGELRRALRLAEDMEADLAALGEVLRRNPVLKAGFEALAHAVAWGELYLRDLVPRGYWLALLLEGCKRLARARGWAERARTPWGTELRYDRSDPGVTTAALEGARKALEELLLSGELRRERRERVVPGDDWAHQTREARLPGGLDVLREAAIEVGAVGRYAPRSEVKAALALLAVELEQGGGKGYLAALWRQVRREARLEKGPFGEARWKTSRRGVLPLARALFIGGYPRKLVRWGSPWGTGEPGYYWDIPETPGALEAQAVARALSLALTGRGALKAAYERRLAEEAPGLEPEARRMLEALDPGGPGGRTVQPVAPQGEEAPLERLARLALEGHYGVLGPLVFVTAVSITDDEDLVAHLLAEALLEEGWGWREFGVPLSLWVRDQILHRLIPAWRGWDPHLHEEVPEEDEGTQQEVPSWDGGFAEAEHRVALERAARVLGEEAARALEALAEEVPEHPFAGMERVRLEEYVRWYFGN